MKAREKRIDQEANIDTSIMDNAIDDSPRDGDQGYQTDEDNVYNDEEEIVKLDNGLIGTSAGRILVPESLKEKILKRFQNSPFAGHLGVKRQRQGFNDAKRNFINGNQLIIMWNNHQCLRNLHEREKRKKPT